MNQPLTFTPWIRPLVWGGHRLADVLGKNLPANESCGESWEISDHPLHRSCVTGGKYQGRTIRDLMRDHPVELLGDSAKDYDVFPWLIKHLDAQDWLSVQVHPDEMHVKRLIPGENSKTEVWFVLGTIPGARVYAGLLPGVNKTDVRNASLDGTVADLLHSFEPQPGDAVFLPSGTVHAVGGGVLFAEVQQTSDATFRLFDWNRKDSQGKSRQLHLEQSLECIHWDSGPVHPIRADGYPATPSADISPGHQFQKLVSCRYFELEYHRSKKPFVLSDERMQVLICVHGKGYIKTGGSHLLLKPGEVILLPASVENIQIHPDPSLGLLRSILPKNVP